ncbi:hypothetical protein [Niastella populi]|uniref:Uncharacterized protein n=1 Tax=Niastella populi TaxID=550983 RepID=A0A1V9FJF5_9BACT|nr:hypothetical protein [Niastella populi]OQP58460.1 hypothetical protein A4R26_03105 [Niastella populi]
MIKEINSYKGLLEEKARLNALLKEQELQIRNDWQSLKEEMKPVAMVGATIKKLFTRKASSTAALIVVNLLADGLVKKVLLSKTGWITRWGIPFLIKNYASHFVDNPENLIKKIKKFFSKNGKMQEETMHQETGMDAV